MFKNPFSFDGRIRRSEYGISFIINSIVSLILMSINAASNGSAIGIVLLCYIPLCWFGLAQGVKRCHDLGNSGWYVIIPFYALWLIFQDGQPGQNQYGMNPKDNNSNSGTGGNYSSRNSNGSGGYSNGNYNGGHNNWSGNQGQTNNSHSGFSNDNQGSTGEYRSGNLYK